MKNSNPSFFIDELSTVDRKWYHRYHELVIYKKRVGHTRVPDNWKENKSLANWVRKQRARKDQLTEWKKELLDKLGFDWVIRKQVKKPVPFLMKDPDAIEKVETAIRDKMISTSEELLEFTMSDYQWYWNVLKVIAFKKEHGHCHIPSPCKEDPSLGNWVNRQRTQKSRLNPQKIQVLDHLGFVWKAKKINKVPWETRFKELLEFREEYGHVNVPQSYPGGLGTWVWLQRRDRDKMKAERKSRLDKLRFTWSFSKEECKEIIIQRNAERWQKRFQELLEFKKTEGHLNVPYDWPVNPALGRWAYRQKCQKSNLAPWKFLQLDQIGFFVKKRRFGLPDLIQTRSGGAFS